ncbi:type II secretion system F family protein [Sinomonas atrocyanea]|uniref:type II secretion system F family protein n=1 Tax=Sinomonas atrocyanea TaxID=37927 RepID=UPI003D956DA1
MSVLLAVAIAAGVLGSSLALRGATFRCPPNLPSDFRGRRSSAPDAGTPLTGAPSVPSGADDVPLLLELLGAMLQAGLSLQRALAVAARIPGPESEVLGRAAAALELGVAWEHAWPASGPGLSAAGRELRDALHFAASTGAPSAELLFSRAGQIRRRRHRELERRAAALGVRLVVPLGVCSLPAFLCLGVVPVLLSMLPSP